MPTDNSPNTMERTLNIMYTTILPRYLDRYCKITENFFMLKSVNLLANLAVLLHRAACFKLKYNRLKDMVEGKRQKQVSALLLQELSDIFQRLGLSMTDGGLVSL